MRLDGAMWALAERQHGCVAAWQLRDLGASRTEIARLRRAPGWRALTPSVLRAVGSQLSDQQIAMAAVLDAGPEARLSHEAAAALWGIGKSYRLTPPHVSRLDVRGERPVTLGRLHRLAEVPSRWLTSLDQIPVLRPELVVYQLCGSVHPERAERALDTAWSMGLLSGKSTRACLDELAASGRNGTVVLRALLDARGDDYTPPASGLEARFQEIAFGGGFSTFERQRDVGTDVWLGRVDFKDRRLPLIVEVQSERYHGALSFAADDAARRARLEAAGYVVVEIWDFQVWHRRAEVVGALFEARHRANRLAA